MLLLSVALVFSGSPRVAQAQTVPAPIVVPENWALKPSAVGLGGQFRLMFMTSTKRDATATDIATYDTFVQNRATNHGHTAIRQYGAQFKVVGSTATVDARDHTMTNPSNSAHPTVAIYWLNGPRVVDDNGELWSNQWDNWKQGQRKTEMGATADNDWHWTGTNVNGTKHTNHLGSSGQVRRGRFWINSGSTGPISHTDTARSESHSFYALSPVFQVAGEPLRHLPAPPSYRHPSFSNVYEGERRNIVFEKVEGSSVSITVSTTATLDQFNLYYPHGESNTTPLSGFMSVETDGVIRSTKTFSASVSNGLVKFAVEGSEDTRDEETFSLEVTLTGPSLAPAHSRIRLPDGKRPRGLLIRTKQGTTPEWVVGDNIGITLKEGSLAVEYQYKFHSDPYKDLYNPLTEVTKEAHITPIVDPLGVSKEGGNRNFFHLDPAADFDRISCVSTPSHGVSWRKGKKADEINDRVDNETGPFGHPYKSALHKYGLDADGNTVNHDMHGGCDHKRTAIYSGNWDQWRSVKFQAGEDADADDHHFNIVHNVAIHADSSRSQAWPVRVHIVDDDKWEQELVFSATEDGTYVRGSEDGLRKALPGALAPGTSRTFYIKLNEDPARLDRNTSISRRVDPNDPDNTATYHPTYQEMETFVRVLGTTVLDNPSPADYGPGYAGVFDISVSPTFKQPGASYIHADPGRPLTDTKRGDGRTDWDEPVEVTITVDAAAPADGAVRIRVDTTRMLQREDTELPGNMPTDQGHYYRTLDYEFKDWVVVPFSPVTPGGMMSEQYTPPAIDAQINQIAIGQLSDTDVKLTWGEMFGEQHYLVDLETQGGGLHSEEADGPVHVIDGLEPDTEHTVQVFYVHEGAVVPTSGSEELTFVTLSEGSDPVTPANPIADLSAAGTSITEGETAVFTLSVNPPSPEPLSVDVDVSHSYNSGKTEIGLAGQLGRRTVVVPTAGRVQIEITTTDNDDTNKDNGVIRLEIVAGAGYQTPQFGGTAQVAVLNDDAPPPNPVTLARITGTSATVVWEAQPGVSLYEIVLLGDGSHDVVTKRTSGTTIEFTGLRSRTMYEAAVWDLEYNRIGEKVRFRTLHPGEVWEAGDDDADTPVDPEDPPTVPPTPVVSISAGSDITEGGTATFTLTASPAPASPLTVSLGVTEAGDFGATGAATVTVSGATTSYPITTTDDAVDEADGTVTVTLEAGAGYTLGTPAAATVAVRDDDAAPPVVINAPRTMTCSPAAIPEGETGSLECAVTAAAWGRVQIQYADRAVAAQYGVTIEGIPAGTTGPTSPCFRGDVETGQFRLTYASAGDGVETPGLGAIRFKWQPVDPAEGDRCQWITSPTDLGSVPIADDADTPVDPEDPPVVQLVTPELSLTAGPAITEGGTATFTLTASPAPASPLTVSLGVTEAGDFGATGAATVTVSGATTSYPITTTDDAVDEADGTVTVTLEAGAGYTLGTPAAATVAVADDDDPPAGNSETLTVSIADAEETAYPGEFLRFTISLSEAAEQEVTVSYEVGSVGATGLIPGLDYCLLATDAPPAAGFGCGSLPAEHDNEGGAVLIAEGEDAAPVFIWIAWDAWVSGRPRLFVQLTEVEGAKEITQGFATGRVAE